MGRTSRSNRSSRSSSPLPTTVFDPGYPPNLKRSLARNDVELAALSKLHVALRTLREAIVNEYGEDALVECVVNEKEGLPSGGSSGKKKDGDDGEKEGETEDGATTTATAADGEDQVKHTEEEDAEDKRLKQLTTAFLLRMKLRRRLLNRLARRLHRVSHIMDSGSNISAPLPPLYGDVVRRYISEEAEKSGVAMRVLGNVDPVCVVRERNVMDFVRGEDGRKETRGELEGRWKRRAGSEEKDEEDKVAKKDVEGENEAKESESVDDGEKDGAEDDEENEMESEDIEKEVNEEAESMDEDSKVETESMDVGADTPDDNVDKEDSAEMVISGDANADKEEGAAPQKSEVDLLLEGDEEDKPLLDQLAEYEPGYEKVYSIGPPPPPLPPASMPSTTASPNADEKTADADVKADAEAPASPTTATAEPTEEINETAASTEESKETSSPSKESVATDSEEKKVLNVSMAVASSTDDHEVDEEGEYLSNKTARLPFSLHASTTVRILHPKERSADWKRWTKEMCEKIPDQVTFDELGVGGAGMVFDLENRMKRKREVVDGQDGEEPKEESDEGVIRGKGGKVLRKSTSPEKAEKNSDEADDGDVKMSDADGDAAEGKSEETETVTKEDESKPKKEVVEKKAKAAAAATAAAKKSTKIFSLTPVPSFHYQDLKRIRILQNEMVNFRQIQRTRERILKAQDYYDKAYRRSIDVQQVRASATADFNKLVSQHKEEVVHFVHSSMLTLSAARSHWKKRQAQIKGTEKAYGEEKALNRNVSNDVLQDLKDRVCIRAAEELDGSFKGLGTYRLKKEAAKAQAEGHDDRNISATMLGHMIDSVERRHADMLQNHTEFVPPPPSTPATVIGDPETGETVAQLHKRKVDNMRKRLAHLDVAFKDAEKKRGEAWVALSRTKSISGSGPPTSSSANKSKSRSRKSTGSSHVRMVSSVQQPGSAAAVAAAAARASYPIQQQQVVPRPGALPQRGIPGYPGYVPASYQQRPPTAASQMQAQMIRAGAAQMLQQAAVVQQAQQTQQAQQLAQMQINNSNLQHMIAQPRPTMGVGQVQAGFHPVQNVVPRTIMVPQQNVRPTTTTIPAASSVPPSAPVAVALSVAVSASSAIVSQVAAAATARSAEQGEGAQKTTTLAKYGYGDKYSQTNVNARKNPDGTIVPASTPKLLPDGRFARPAGRQRKGMDWDAVRGCWFPVPEGQQQQGEEEEDNTE